jgi:predicted nucleic acid-binding protein
MRILFDTNVVLDVLLARQPHAEVAACLFDCADRGLVKGLVCATTLTTIHYLATKAVGAVKARKYVQDLLDVFDVAPVDRTVLLRALELRLTDFEDAVLHEAARAAGATGIVTRNKRDFASARLPIFDPRELLLAVNAARR